MKYSILWLENKDKLKELKLRDVYNGEEIDAVIWKTDKDGKIFPGYDLIVNGGEVEGNLWTNPKNGSKTLYPPDPKRTTGAAKPNITKAMETKRENIAEAQGRKESSIEMAATARDATLLTVEWAKGELACGTPPSTAQMKEKWLEWRTWLTHQFGSANIPF